MNINALSKYIILFLFTMLVVLSVLLGIEKASNNTLTKENARLTEMVVLRDTAINEIDKNITSLQEQVLEAESICEERLKARENLLTFLSMEPNWKGNSEARPADFSFSSRFGREKVVLAGKRSPHPNRPLLQGQVPQKCDSATLDLNNKVGVYEVISKNKSDYAVNSINSYISMFLTQSSDSKK